MGGPDPGPLTPGAAEEASPDTWAGAHRGRAGWRARPGAPDPRTAREASQDTRAGANRGRAGWRMGGPDPGPLTPGMAGEASPGPPDNPGRGPSGKGRLEDGRARPGAPDHPERQGRPPWTRRTPGPGQGRLEDGRARPGAPDPPGRLNATPPKPLNRNWQGETPRALCHPAGRLEDRAHDPWWAHCLGPTGVSGSEPLSPARQWKPSGACGTPPRVHHGTGEWRRCAAGCWSSGVGPPPTPSRSSHPVPGRSFPSQGPRWAACGPGPAGSLRRHTPPALTGEGVLRLGRQAAQSRPPNRPCPERPESGLDSASAPRGGFGQPGALPGSSSGSAPGAGTVQLVLHAGLVQDRKPVGLGGARVLPGLSPPYPGLGVLPLGGCLPPSWSPGETRRLKPGPPRTLSPHRPACPGCPFFSTIKPPRSGGLQNPGGETKVGVSRPARRSDQMARDDPGSAAGRPALDSSGRALALGGASQGWLASPATLAARGFPAPAIWSSRRPAKDGGTPPPYLHPAAQGRRPPCRVARGGGGLPRARARRPSPPARRQRDAGGRPRTETKAWLRG
ncbi:hypothetical protein NDU88_004766 [Pleurodeles waltl]|uniref:Collagen alpha-1(I) chain-like n=1 Tax=Pleurodeles waltl TaxID=8319 RepID=A0AAV7V3V4_PLEWA|nr:hypothetical protein NDU88_004766 [Pleurodeles waltl]